jgi:glucokinase
MESNIVGIDIGGSKTKIATYDTNGLHTFFHEPTPQNADEFVQMVTAGIERANFPGVFSGIGIGCPGPLNQETGEVLSPPNLRQWDRFPLVDRLADHFEVPVFLDNDGNAGALGEALFGSARNHNRVFYMTLSTGLGTGLVLDKKIYRGAHGLAGEIWAFDQGLFPVADREVIINDMGSGNGMIKEALRYIQAGERTEIPPDVDDSRIILEASERGDGIAEKVVRHAREVIAATICMALYLLDPDIIVLGGGLCTKPHRILEPVLDIVSRKLRIDSLKRTPIVRAELWEDVVLYGAIGLVMESSALP